MQGTLTIAWDAFRSGDLALAKSEASQFINSEDLACVLDAKKLLALVYFRERDFSSALPLFSDVAQSSTDANDWFNVVTSATLSGNVPASENAFEKAFECQRDSGFSQTPSVPFMLFYYACALKDIEQYEKAFAKLDELKSIISGLPTTDSQYLYSLSVPPLSAVLALSEDVFRGLRDSVNIREWLHSFGPNVDDEGRLIFEKLLALFPA